MQGKYGNAGLLFTKYYTGLYYTTLSLSNNRMVRGGLVPRGIWGWIQGVGLVKGVTRSGDTPYGMASGGQEEPFSRLYQAFLLIFSKKVKPKKLNDFSGQNSSNR